MSADNPNPRPAEMIRRRAEELAASGNRNMVEAELLAAAADQGLSFDEIDEESLRLCIEAFGPDIVSDAFSSAGEENSAQPERFQRSDLDAVFTESTPFSKSPLPIPGIRTLARPPWRMRLGWVAAAAAVLVVSAVVVRKAGQPVRPAQSTVSSGRPAPNTEAAKNEATDAESERPAIAGWPTATPANRKPAENVPSAASSPAGPTDNGSREAAPPTPATVTSSADIPSTTPPNHSVAQDNPSQQQLAASSNTSDVLNRLPTAGATTASHALHGLTAAFAGAAHGGAGNTSHAAISRPAPRDSVEHVTHDGSAIRVRPNGEVSDVHDTTANMDVHHGLDGSRRVSVERPGHGRVMYERGRPGYVQRGYGYHGHDFARRSYYYHGHAYDRYYHGYPYRGAYLHVYAPAYYYGPGFYGWAYNPWAVPIAYGWGWGGNPWYGFYGGYFAPYPVYPSAAFWLTDYIISQDLQAAYAARKEAELQAAGDPAAGGPPALTPEMKQMIADEVKNQLALENAEAAQNAQKQDIDPGSSGIARMLSDGKVHAFVVGGSLDVTQADSGQECALSDGDALALKTPPAADATTANVVVLASKGAAECHANTVVSVAVSDLQDMQNHLRETIDTGLQELQAKQGKGGLPQAPASAQAKPVQAAYAEVAPPPDPAADNADLQVLTQSASQAEMEVKASVSRDPGSPAGIAPPVIASPISDTSRAVQPHQTIDEVRSILGEPKSTVNLGSKVIYYYKDLKVTFTNGRVSNVE